MRIQDGLNKTEDNIPIVSILSSSNFEKNILLGNLIQNDIELMTEQHLRDLDYNTYNSFDGLLLAKIYPQ